MTNSAQLFEFTSSIVLDVEIASIATVDAISISVDTGASDSQALSIARAEAWRQLRARNVFPHDVPLFAVDGDPVAALTPIERTVLALSLRLKVDEAEIATIVGLKRKETAAVLKESRRQLARAAIAMTMLTNETRCPITTQSQQTFGADIKRSQALFLVTHAAECQICVPVLRTVDRQIITDYINAAAIGIPASIDNAVAALSDADREKLVNRARLKAGWAQPDENLSQDPKRMLKRAVAFGAVSALCVLLGLILAAR